MCATSSMISRCEEAIAQDIGWYLLLNAASTLPFMTPPYVLARKPTAKRYRDQSALARSSLRPCRDSGGETQHADGTSAITMTRARIAAAGSAGAQYVQKAFRTRLQNCTIQYPHSAAGLRRIVARDERAVRRLLVRSQRPAKKTQGDEAAPPYGRYSIRVGRFYAAMA